MAQEAFQRKIMVNSTPADVWQAIIDVPKLVGWVSILREAEMLAPLEKYTAVLTDKIGMFKLSADLNIRVVEKRDGEFIRVTASGEDRQVGSRIVVRATVELTPHGGDQTAVDATGEYEVSGRVATMGGSAIRKKADKILNEFADSVQREFA